MTDPRPPKDEDERRKLIMELYGVGETEANFIMDIEDGKIEGDVMPDDTQGLE